ncbi:peroxide stress protein YaaA [Limosilactobacillus kribbianus]|uniref:peroxide stress protein YaaA n=1 Tax=Limosilactobacillus kribbianus TaxID=2982695 RepID=UPI002264F31B|nr:peroxide stress protein YaaA [Limosilactobacillus kribbianus]
MKIIISPARTMRVDTDSLPYQDLPQFLPQARQILAWMRTQTYDQLHELWWHCSTRLARTNYQWLQEMDLTRELTPAIIAFCGLQYQAMAPDVFSDRGLDYIEKHLRILSGFYGLLRPFDGIVPYRLGMGDRAHVDGTKNLYEFWGDRLYQELYCDDDLVINLASKEYEKAVRPYLQPGDRFVTCLFGEVVGDRVKQKATRAKMARGDMVRYLAENAVDSLDGLKAFDVAGYHYRPEYSTAERLAFTKE